MNPPTIDPRCRPAGHPVFAYLPASNGRTIEDLRCPGARNRHQKLVSLFSLVLSSLFSVSFFSPSSFPAIVSGQKKSPCHFCLHDHRKRVARLGFIYGSTPAVSARRDHHRRHQMEKKILRRNLIRQDHYRLICGGRPWQQICCLGPSKRI